MKLRIVFLIGLLFLLTVFKIAAAQPDGPIPAGAAPKFHPEAKLIALAKQKLSDAGLNQKYDLNRPVYLQTPSQLGQDYVGFPLADTRQNPDGDLRLHCLVHVSALYGTVIRVQELIKPGDTVVLAHLTPDGNLSGYTIDHPQKPLTTK